jgi:hypothetical protein
MLVVSDVGKVNPPGQVFIVGMNGSGTTMLRDHLACHPEIYGFPFETRSLPYFILHQDEFGDLGSEENFLRLWRAMKTSIGKRAGVLPPELPLPEAGNRTATGAFDHIMRYLAQAEGKRIWCEKTPMYIHHMPLLAGSFPQARFLHIIRDGRDCAASFHRRWRFNPVRTISRWKKVVNAGRRDGQTLGARYWEVRYEELTEGPEAAFRDLLAFLGLPYEAAVLRASKSKREDSTASSARIERNARRSTDYFDSEMSRKLESVAGRLLTELGYESINKSGDFDPPAWRMKLWQVTDDARRFAAVVTRHGRLLKPSKWRYLASRTRNALKQRATLK